MVLRGYLTKSPSKTITPSTRASLIAILVALSVSSNYALVWIPNVKFMDLLVFVAGFIAGPLDGAMVGILTWIVYGFLNPYGWVPTILIATTLAETIYGIFGGILRRKSSQAGRAELALLGLLCTFLYDLLTNFVFALTFKIPLTIAFLAGIPFALVHELSNAALFSIVGPELIGFINKIFLPKANDKGTHSSINYERQFDV